MRCFFALLPPPPLRDSLLAVQARFPAGGRPVPAANLHLTLVFLGQLSAAQLEPLRAACDRLSPAAFDLCIDQAGYWPEPAMAWLGPQHSPAPLLRLVDDLQQLALARQLSPELRPYRPHVTLFRKVKEAPVLPDFSPLPWQPESYSLLESVSLPEGVQYRELARWPLLRPAGA